METYYVALTLAGLLVFGAALLPRLFEGKPGSLPIVYVVAGAALFALPVDLGPLDPLERGDLVEKLTEFLVIVALMGAGLKLERPFDIADWRSTWRLLAVAMPLTIAAAAFLGWGVVGFAVPTAMLLGAVIAPTDPVLAADVQVGPPRSGEEAEVDPTEREDDVRFALTSEAGLNDGLAFPFTYLAVAMATHGVHPENWFVDWLLVDVLYKIVGGVAVGYVVGRALAQFMFRSETGSRLADAMQGSMALAATLISYGATELAGAYGFIAVFVTALTVRHVERDHEYNQALHDFAETVERLTMAGLLVLFGGSLVGGLLDPLTTETVLVGLALVLLVRPVAGFIGFLGSRWPSKDELAVAFFGVRGIGSFYYLAYALNQTAFAGADLLWALVAFVVLVSVVLHGLTAGPAMRAIS